jgi:hypothetical protein
MKRKEILCQGCSTSNETTGYQLNTEVYEVFRSLRCKGFPVNGPTLKLIARKIANRHSNKDFIASNGWLHRFKKQFDIKFKTLQGEARSADKEGAENFRSTFNDLIKKYGEENIFNCDETAIFYKTLSKKSFVEKNESSSGHKMRKERLSLLLCCSYTGEKYKPLIIGRSKSPRVLRGVNLKAIGIEYDASYKAWMTKSIFENWLSRFNEEMRGKGRKVALLIDNATCHATSIQYSNIDVIFFPKNTTSLIQPCDQGIIKAFKNHFNNWMMRTIIYDKNPTAEIDEVIKAITILDAMSCSKMAWDEITESTIQNCFEKALEIEIYDSRKQQDNKECPIDQDIVENAILETVSDDDNSDEEDSSETFVKHLDYEKSIKDTECAFTTLLNVIKQETPENVLHLYKFKADIMSSLRKKQKNNMKITDFFIKK